MRVTITLDTESSEMIGELTELIGSSPTTLISRMVNATLSTWYVSMMQNNQKEREDQTEMYSRIYLKENWENTKFQDFVLTNYPGDDPEAEISIRDIVKAWIEHLSKQDTDSSVPQTPLEPEQDLAKLDEESRWDFKGSQTGRFNADTSY